MRAALRQDCANPFHRRESSISLIRLNIGLHTKCGRTRSGVTSVGGQRPHRVLPETGSTSLRPPESSSRSPHRQGLEEENVPVQGSSARHRGGLAPLHGGCAVGMPGGSPLRGRGSRGSLTSTAAHACGPRTRPKGRRCLAQRRPFALMCSPVPGTGRGFPAKGGPFLR